MPARFAGGLSQSGRHKAGPYGWNVADEGRHKAGPYGWNVADEGRHKAGPYARILADEGRHQAGPYGWIVADEGRHQAGPYGLGRKAATMADKYVIGIDVGTQSLRVMVFDLSGQPLGSASQSYPTHYDRVSWAEQEPNDWWAAAVACCRKAVAEAGVSPESVVGLSVDSTSCTVLPVKQNGMPLRRALLWMDVRAVEQAQQVTRTKHPFLKYVSWVESPEWMIPKALWLKTHQPEIYHEADLIIECQDWMLHRLTGRWVAALNQATCKWNYAAPEGG